MNLIILLVFLVASVSGCKTHLEQEMKTDSESHDKVTVADDTDSTVADYSWLNNSSETTDTKTEDPTVTDTTITVQVAATDKKPAKTITIQKHQVKGAKTETKVDKTDSSSSNQTTGVVDEHKTTSASHDEKAKTDAKLTKDFKPSFFGFSMVFIWIAVVVLVVVVIGGPLLLGNWPRVVSWGGGLLGKVLGWLRR